ncbi:hypothetical protein AACH06_23340 [Ideonella sp. DXS29W]|uniref:Secreted protein n=1 Tax=Ideonella lacteola TaxID=2984193 RepID=A0ABU9BWF1_9BURK
MNMLQTIGMAWSSFMVSILGWNPTNGVWQVLAGSGDTFRVCPRRNQSLFKLVGNPLKSITCDNSVPGRWVSRRGAALSHALRVDKNQKRVSS